MAWITITSEDVLRRFTKPEGTAVLTIATQEGQTADDLMTEAIRAVTLDVRGAVGACEKNTLGPEGTIPAELLADALALIRRYLFTRFPGSATKSLFGEERAKEAERADRKLERTADCKVAIVPPETPSPDQPAGPAVQVVNTRPRIFTRETMQGL